MSSRKYVSKIYKGNDTLYIKDTEAREAITDETSRATEAEDLLREIYESLVQSDLVVGPLPVTGVERTIYRVANISGSSYSDYMYYNNDWVLLATYNNAIDESPTEDSENLVYSGGVYEWGAEVGNVVADPTDDWNPGTAEQYFEELQTNIITLTGVVNNAQLAIGAVPIDTVPTEDSPNLLTSGAIYYYLGTKTDSSDFESHTEDDTIHITQEERDAWNASYTLPVTGIPATDLSLSVQDSLALADNSVQFGELVDVV